MRRYTAVWILHYFVTKERLYLTGLVRYGKFQRISPRVCAPAINEYFINVSHHLSIGRISLTSNSEVLIHPQYRSLFRGDISGPSLTATYYVNSSELNLESAAFHMASTISSGLGVHFKYLKEGLKYLKRCCPKVSVVPSTKKNEGYIKLSLPLQWMMNGKEYLDITQVLSFIYGDFFEERQMTRVKLMDLDFSTEAIDFFKGPLWGIDKIRDALNTLHSRRPHIAVVPHPPLGMSAEKYAQQCYQLALAGVDHIVDSDVLLDPPHCSIQDRTTLVIEAIEKSQHKTGNSVLYSVNISANTDRLIENADKVIEACGKNGIVVFGVCVANTGLSGLSMLREYVERKKRPIHAHVTGLPLMTRNPTFGINYRAFNTLVRLLGADIVHAGSLTGRYLLVLQKMHNGFLGTEPMVYQSPVPSEKYLERMRTIAREESTKEAIENNETLTSKSFRNSSGQKIKATFQLVAGGINPTNVEYNIRLLGNDIILLSGAGLFRGPPPSKGDFKEVQSTIRGIRQAIDVTMDNENVGNAVKDPRRKSKVKDLAKFIKSHAEEFDLWDWRKQHTALRELDRFKPYTN